MLKTHENKGITLIALVITIIVLLILAGITIAMITGQDSAPQKAAEAKLENDKGAMRDTATLLATKYIQDYYDKKYVKNLSDFTYANQGIYAEAQFQTATEGGYTYSISEHTLTVTDAKGNVVTGTINSNGTITWIGKMPETNIKVDNEIIDLSTLNSSNVGQYYGTEIVTINNKKYELYYVDYAGDFGEAGTVYLKSSAHISTKMDDGITDADMDIQTAQRTEALRIMKLLNPDWALNRGTIAYDSMQNNEKGAAYLCNPSNSKWSNIQTLFKNKYGASNVNYVVGAPSSEMLAKSMTQAVGLSENETIDSRWFNSSSSTDITKKSRYTYSGYLFSITGRNTTSSAGYDSTILPTTQRDALTAAQKNMYYKRADQWLASPNSANQNYYVCAINYSCLLCHNEWDDAISTYPLISLKPGVDLTK